MTKQLTVWQEAKSPMTPPTRLIQLAAMDNPKLQRIAIYNPSFPLNWRELFVTALKQPAQLTPTQLESLAPLGLYTAKLAISSEAANDTTIVALTLQGYFPLVLKSTKYGPSWLIAQASNNPQLLHFLTTHQSVPGLLRIQAAKLGQVKPTQTIPAQTVPAQTVPAQSLTEQLPPQEAANAPSTSATVSSAQAEQTLTLRERLLRRQEYPQLTAAEMEEIKSERRLGNLAARHPLVPLELLRWLDQQYPHGEAHETLLQRLEQGPVDTEQLLQVALKGQWEERAAVARNPALLAHARIGLSVDEDWWVRAAVAENPLTTPEELSQLAADRNHVTVREHVAVHPNAAAQTLLELSRDGEYEVRLGVARNPGTPPEALRQLATDQRYAVREAVAAHPQAPTDALNALADDVHERVRSVALIRQSPPSVDTQQAQQLLATRRRTVKLALTTKELPAELLMRLAQDRNPAVRARLALHPQLPESLIAQLMQDTSYEVRQVARSVSPALSTAELAQLPLFDARVREGLSRNIQAPTDVLIKLSDDPLENIRLNVLINQSAPGPALEKHLPERALRPQIRQHPNYFQVQDRLRKMEWQEVHNPEVSAQTLEELSFSDALRVRTAVAAHSLTADAVLARLITEGSHTVWLTIINRQEELSYEVQLALAQHSSEDIRKSLLLRKDIQPATLLYMAEAYREDKEFTLHLLHQPYTGAGSELWAVAARSPFPVVRQIIARENTDISVLETLVSDTEIDVKRAILDNPARTPTLLKKLILFPALHLDIARDAKSIPEILEELAYDTAFDRFLTLDRWSKHLPFHEHPILEKIRKNVKARISRNAFKDILLLSAIIEHPNATPRALEFAQRLQHISIEEANKKRQTILKQSAQKE